MCGCELSFFFFNSLSYLPTGEIVATNRRLNELRAVFFDVLDLPRDADISTSCTNANVQSAVHKCPFACADKFSPEQLFPHFLQDIEVSFSFFLRVHPPHKVSARSATLSLSLSLSLRRRHRRRRGASWPKEGSSPASYAGRQLTTWNSERVSDSQPKIEHIFVVVFFVVGVQRRKRKKGSCDPITRSITTN